MMTDQPDDPIDRLLAGFERFRDRYFKVEPQVYEQLATGQAPKVAVVACCDSRVDPAIVTDCAPGELFTIRNVANLVPPCEPEGTYHGTSAAIEFAVRCLEVEHLVVLGHAQCGGIKALVDGGVDGEFIDHWVELARPALMRVPPDLSPDERLRACEQAAVEVSLQNLLTFPWIRERVADGRLQLHGWYFDLAAGELKRLAKLTQDEDDEDKG